MTHDGDAAQDVWCQPLLSGEKVEETRRYTLPDDILGALAVASQSQPKAVCITAEYDLQHAHQRVLGRNCDVSEGLACAHRLTSWLSGGQAGRSGCLRAQGRRERPRWAMQWKRAVQRRPSCGPSLHIQSHFFRAHCHMFACPGCAQVCS